MHYHNMFNIRNHYCLGNVLQRLNDFNYNVGENKPVYIYISNQNRGSILVVLKYGDRKSVKSKIYWRLISIL